MFRSRTMTARLPSIVAGLLALCVCGAYANREARAERSAVVLIPGLGNEAAVWELKGYLEQFADHPQFYPAGHVRVEESIPPGLRSDVEAAYGRHEIPVFAFSFPGGGEGDIRLSGRQLADGLTRLRLAHGVESFWLVGESLGGVIAREYLTSPSYADDVKGLVTVSSPHGGSELAYLPEIYHRLKACSEEQRRRSTERRGGWLSRSMGFCQSQFAGAGLKAAACLREIAARAQWNIEAEAVRMLLPPESGNYLAQLNARLHPRDVDYVCVVTEMSMSNYACGDLVEDWKQWRRGIAGGPCRTMPVLADLLRSSMHLGLERMGCSKSAMAGDGVLSVFSQNLNNAAVFARDTDLSAKVLRLTAGHHHAHHQFRLADMLAATAAVAAVP